MSLFDNLKWIHDYLKILWRSFLYVAVFFALGFIGCLLIVYGFIVLGLIFWLITIIVGAFGFPDGCEE